ncbi:MAG: hypothetical protein IKB04_01600 [Clostridia bacterium]|nr:hypothetical protein [Clostridia bacterium]
MKRVITTLLALILVIGCLPVSGAAAGKADLTVESLTFTGGDGQITPETTLTIHVTVANNGNAAAEEFTVQLYTAAIDLVRQSTVESLAAGKTTTVIFHVLFSAKMKGAMGDYMLVAEADATNTVAESNERNNTRQRNLRVANDRVAPAYSSMEDILKQAGMTDLIFNDDFNDPNSVDNQNTHKAGYKWYITRPYGAPDLGAGDYSVENGVMTVKNEVPTYNYGLGTTDMDSHVGFDFNTGYLEVKLRIPRPRKNTEGEKGVPAIWALPSEKLFYEYSHWVELDWLEYWGDNYYTICLHEQKREAGGETTQWTKNSNTSFSGLNDGEWHVMGWLWQEGLFISYLDGKEVMRLKWAKGELAWPVQTVNTGELELGAFVKLDEQHLPIIIGGSQDNPLELDYVRVWDGKTTGTYTPPEKEPEKQEPIVMQMSASDFVHDYTTDDYAEPIITVTTDNYKNILNGESAWNTLSAERRTEINDLLKQNGQPTYEHLLTIAKQFVSNGGTTAKGTTKATKATAKPTKAPVKKTTNTSATLSTTATESTVTTTDTTIAATTTAPEEQKKNGFPWVALLPMGVAVIVAVGLPLWLAYQKKKQQ